MKKKIAMLLAAVMTAACLSASVSSPVSAAPAAQPAATGTAAQSGQDVLISLSFTGDCTLGTDVHFSAASSLPAYYNKYGPDYFLAGVRPFFAEDDLTCVNLEGTLTTSGTRANKTYAFRGDPSYTAILTGSSVELCNFANNHNRDYGNQSFVDTANALNAAGIGWFCDDVTYLTEVRGVKVGFLGIYELEGLLGCDSLVKADIANLKAQGAEYIAIEFHWGIERDAVPDAYQVTLAHNAIDYGADLVVGAHPHVLQGIETYKGKQIVYSMGNFCFGGNSNPSDKDTMIYRMYVLMGTNADGTHTVRATQEDVIPCRLSSVPNYNNYQPIVLIGQEAERVIAKIQQRSNGIAAKYGVTADTVVCDPRCTQAAYDAAVAQAQAQAASQTATGQVSAQK